MQSSLERMVLEQLANEPYKPKFVLESFFKVNRAKILLPTLLNGWEIARERALIRNTVIGYHYRKVFAGIEKALDIQTPFPFFVATVGGDGREEVLPLSDVDLAFFADTHTDDRPAHPILQGYADECLNQVGETKSPYIVKEKLGFSIPVIVNNLQSVPDFDEVKFCSLIDMKFLFGNKDFFETAKHEIKKNFNPLDLFLHIERTYKVDVLEKNPQSINSTDRFNVKNGRGGARAFNIGGWIEAMEQFVPLSQIYSMQHIPEEALQSMGIILKTRAWIHERRIEQKKVKDANTLYREDFDAFSEFFGSGAIKTLTDARKCIEVFTQSRFSKALSAGIPANSCLTYGHKGLKRNGNVTDFGAHFYHVLEEAQKRNLAIDSDEFFKLYHSRHLVKSHAQFPSFFIMEGDLAGTLETLDKMSMLEKVIPGYSLLESQLCHQEHRHSHLTKSGSSLQKIRNLGALNEIAKIPLAKSGSDIITAEISKVYSEIDSNQRMAIRLALLVNQIPALMNISASEYVFRLKEMYPTMSSECCRTVRLLVQEQDYLRQTVRVKLNDDQTVGELASLVGNDIGTLQSLFVFSYANLWDSVRNPLAANLWDNMIELYDKTSDHIQGIQELSAQTEHEHERQAIQLALPREFIGSKYAKHFGMTSNCITAIAKVVEARQSGTPEAVVKTVPFKNMALLRVVSEQRQDTLEKVAGACYTHGLNIMQVHTYRLGDPINAELGFYDIASLATAKPEFFKEARSILLGVTQLALDARQILENVELTTDLQYSHQSGLYTLTVKTDTDKKGILYAMMHILRTELDADIFATHIYTHRNQKNVSDAIFFKSPLELTAARDIVAKHIG